MRKTIFAETVSYKMRHLFATFLKESGKPYKFQDVADATTDAVEKGELSAGVTVRDLSRLTLGQVGNPSYLKLRAVAWFFEIPMEYFSDEKLDVDQATSPLAEMSFRMLDVDFDPETMEALGKIFSEMSQVRRAYLVDEQDDDDERT